MRNLAILAILALLVIPILAQVGGGSGNPAGSNVLQVSGPLTIGNPTNETGIIDTAIHWLPNADGSYRMQIGPNIAAGHAAPLIDNPTTRFVYDGSTNTDMEMYSFGDSGGNYAIDFFSAAGLHSAPAPSNPTDATGALNFFFLPATGGWALGSQIQTYVDGTPLDAAVGGGGMALQSFADDGSFGGTLDLRKNGNIGILGGAGSPTLGYFGGTPDVAIRRVSAGILEVNTGTPGTLAEVDANLTATKIVLTLHTPANSSETCTAGQFVDDANYHYVCVTTNTWKRVALSGF